MEEIEKRSLKETMTKGFHQNEDLRELLELATKKTVNTGLKAFRIFNVLQTIRSIVISTIWYAILFGTAWWASAYTHESDLIRVCTEGGSMKLLHSDYVVSTCMIKPSK